MTTLFCVHERCANVNKNITYSLKEQQDQQGLTYTQEPKLKKPLIRLSKSPSEKVVSLSQERRDIEERKAGERSRSILAALIAVIEKHDRQKRANSHHDEQ
jgi:hypothetical protein